MERNVIAISGKQRSGKDSLAGLLLARLKGYKRIGFADALKDMYCRHHNLTREELEILKNTTNEHRKGLIDLASSVRASNLYHFADVVLLNPCNIIIPDLRYQFELDYLKLKVSRLVTIRVEASRDIRSGRGLLSNEADPSETSLDGCLDAFDHVIYNNHTPENLVQECEKIINALDVSQ